MLVAAVAIGGASALDIMAQADARVRPAEMPMVPLSTPPSPQAQGGAASVLDGLYTLARASPKVTSARRVTFDNTWCLGCCAVVQGVLTMAIVHAAPRLAL